MKYDTATNSFRAGKIKPNPLPLRKERKQLPGGFSRPLKSAKVGQSPRDPQATNRPPGSPRSFNFQKYLPPE